MHEGHACPANRPRPHEHMCPIISTASAVVLRANSAPAWHGVFSTTSSCTASNNQITATAEEHEVSSCLIRDA